MSNPGFELIHPVENRFRNIDVKILIEILEAGGDPIFLNWFNKKYTSNFQLKKFNRKNLTKPELIDLIYDEDTFEAIAAKYFNGDFTF
jgi:hypothetical protein